LRSFSLRKRLVLAASLVLIIALGLVGFALNQANYRGAVSSLQARMESYVYLVLAAMEVGARGGLEMDEDFSDPRLLQPSSGIYVRVRGQGAAWDSKSSLGLEWPERAPSRPLRGWLATGGRAHRAVYRLGPGG
jgi:hypothetical protein